ncbi:putative lipase YDR444W isoform X2 [Typha latifolia]|uniref:putative lipase YDR444W isoform X2 n=1 Tax=Typha latifolia TaxID=4733 RepID=UPI003C2DE84E
MTRLVYFDQKHAKTKPRSRTHCAKKSPVYNPFQLSRVSRSHRYHARSSPSPVLLNPHRLHLMLAVRSMAGSATPRGRQSRWPRLRLGFGIACFKPLVASQGKEKKVEVEAASGGEDMWSSAVEPETDSFPDHLVVMINGLSGSPEDWKFAAEQFVKRLPNKVFVHRSECNYSKLTYDGVDMMGERLAAEVRSVIARRRGIQKISFVAHSLGGLVARYAIGRLYEPQNRAKSSSSAEGCLDEGNCLEGRIVGLEPMNFITSATPHLGSMGHKQLPFLCGIPFLERRASQTAHLIVGRTGKHLFLTDNDDGKPPLLLQMVDDSDDIKFRSALCSFKRRVAYANVNYDHIVGWRTSSIRRQHELPKRRHLVHDEKYPHIVYVDKEKIENNNKEHAVIKDWRHDLEEEMIRGLTQVSWERVDVSFQKSRQRYIAHNTIQSILSFNL